MQLFLFRSAFVLAALTSALSPARAESAATAEIPQKARENLLKRHPQAQDLRASHETHFGNKLLEISFKEGDQTLLELYRSNGALFTNEMPVEDSLLIPPTVVATLTKQFPDYQYKKAELIANPNGAGEEYEIYLTLNDVNWKVTIDDKGNIHDKSQY